MPEALDPRVVATFRIFGWLASLAAVLLGAAVLAGWLAGDPVPVTVLPGLAAMAPVTAGCFVLAGLSLGARKAGRPALAAVAAVLMLAVTGAVLTSHVLRGRDVINPVLVPVLASRMPGGAGDPMAGSTAPATACGFLLLGAALLAAGGRGRRAEWVMAGSAAAGLLLSALVLLGYVYGVEGLYATAFFRTVALHTAAGLLVLFLACLLHDPERGWAAIIATRGPNGAAIRIQLLLTTLLPFVVGLVVLQAMRTDGLSRSLGVAILVATTMVPIVLRILQDGRTLDELDAQRRLAVAAQVRLTEELERRVDERTALLASSEARLRTYFDHAPEGLVVFRLDGGGVFVVDAVNPAFRAMFALGDRDITGVPLAGFATPDAAADGQGKLDACLRSGQPTPYKVTRLIAGRPRVIDVVLAPVPPLGPGDPRLVVGSVRDVSDAEGREEQLRQAHKMEAIGQLTGGLAHDFNNLLTGITGSLELLGTRLSQGRTEDAARYIAAARGAATRAAALTHRLLAFSRRQTLDPQPTDINRLVAGMEELVRRTAGPAIAVEVVAAGGLWATLIDPNQLENALLNLCINARDAMPEGGRVTIETGNRWLDERAAADRDLPPGQYVSLCVSDTGTGMTADIAARAFDPFFTTKPTGMGTGLGLSMAYGFVRQSGGQARIYSEPGQGTMVCLYLPRHHGVVTEPDAPADPDPAPGAAAGEVVLVVDDEPTIRMLVREVLDELGYATIEAADGAAGVRVLQSDARIDLLVTDVGLPGGLNGRQVADTARAVRPGLKVLFITGYAENAVLNHGHLAPGMQVLTKPFAMTALTRRIKDLVAGPVLP